MIRHSEIFSETRFCGGCRESGERGMKAMRVLVVEDEKALNRVISKRLEKEGYSVDSCFDGEDAIHYLRMGEFDAVIMDIMMPRLSGIDAVKRMRAAGNGTRRRSRGLSCEAVRV